MTRIRSIKEEVDRVYFGLEKAKPEYTLTGATELKYANLVLLWRQLEKATLRMEVTGLDIAEIASKLIDIRSQTCTLLEGEKCYHSTESSGLSVRQPLFDLSLPALELRMRKPLDILGTGPE